MKLQPHRRKVKIRFKVEMTITVVVVQWLVFAHFMVFTPQLSRAKRKTSPCWPAAPHHNAAGRTVGKTCRNPALVDGGAEVAYIIKLKLMEQDLCLWQLTVFGGLPWKSWITSLQ
jgi:hypothetical protein